MTLEAAGVDLSNVEEKPTSKARATLVCWYDMTSSALRLFVVGDDDLDGSAAAPDDNDAWVMRAFAFGI